MQVTKRRDVNPLPRPVPGKAGANSNGREPDADDVPAAAPRDAVDRRILLACDAAGAFIEYWGFKAIHGRVGVLVAVSQEPLSQAEIAEQLGVSRSLVNQAVQELEGYGLVRPLTEQRKSPYVALLDVWPAITDVLREREWRLIENARQTLEAALQEVELAKSGRYDPARLRLLLSLTEAAQALVSVLIGIRIPKNVERIAEWVTRAGTIVRALRLAGE